MKRKPARTTHNIQHTRHAPPFYILFAVITFCIGVFATIIFTKVLAEANSVVVHTCVQNVSGNIRIVDEKTQCKSNEYALNWNKEGIQGPPGQPGQQGQPGQPGQPGQSATGTGLPFFCSYPCYLTQYADKMRGKDFSGAQSFQANFVNADLTGVIFKGALFISARFDNANLTNSDFSDIHDIPGWDVAKNNKFIGANLTNANFSKSSFTSSDFSNTNLQNTNLSNAVLKNDKFTGAQNMSTANISGTVWDNVICPDGSNSNNNGSTCANHF